MTSAQPKHVTEVRNHWLSWRPGWRQGRHVYVCHLTLTHQPKLRRLIQQYQGALAQLPNLDLIPAHWLHLTMQEIGFTDEINADDLAHVTASLKEELSKANPPTATFHLATVVRGAVYLQADPAEPLYQLRKTMHSGISSVLGYDRLHDPLPESWQFHPHVSMAYVNTDGPAQPIIKVIQDVDAEPVTTTFSTASILIFHREHQMYEWTHDTPLPIGRPA